MNLLRCVPFLLALFLASVARAETPEELARTVRVTMTLNDVPPGAAMHFIELVSKIKTHYVPRQGDPLLQLDIDNVTADEALKYIAQLANLELTYQADGAHFAPKK